MFWLNEREEEEVFGASCTARVERALLTMCFFSVFHECFILALSDWPMVESRAVLGFVQCREQQIPSSCPHDSHPLSLQLSSLLPQTTSLEPITWCHYFKVKVPVFGFFNESLKPDFRSYTCMCNIFADE